ncbi:MAG: cytochrome c-type biogenesis protein [Bacillota bacterium]
MAICKKPAAVFFLLILSLLLSAAPLGAAEIDQNLQKEIEEMLVCQDDCGMILSACDNQTAQYMRKIVIDRLQKGQGKDEILGYFVSIYGEKVLAAPQAKGFNITAWVTPFLAVILGGVLIYFVLDKWVFNARLDEMDELNESEKKLADLSEYEDQLDKELKKYL